MQLYKVRVEGGGGDDQDGGEHDEEDEDEDEEDNRTKGSAGGGSYDKPREKRTKKQEEREGYSAVLLYTWLCRRVGALERARALLHDLLAVNGRAASVAQIAAMLQAWPAVLGGQVKQEGGGGGLMARLIPALLSEAMDEPTAHLQDAGPSSAATAYEGLCAAMGWEAGALKEGSEALADEVLGLLVDEEAGEALSEGRKVEAIRALHLVACARDLGWARERLLTEYATGDLGTPPLMMRLLASVGRDLAMRGVVVQRSGEVMRTLRTAFYDVLTAVRNEWDEDEALQEPGAVDLVKLWACKGLADLPGVSLGDLSKAAVAWLQALSQEQLGKVPPFVLRTVSGSGGSHTQRP